MCKAIHLNIELSIVSRKLKNIPFLIRCESLHWLLNRLNIKWILDYSFSIFFSFVVLRLCLSGVCVQYAAVFAHWTFFPINTDDDVGFFLWKSGRGLTFCCRLLFVGGVCQAGDSMPKGMCNTL